MSETILEVRGVEKSFGAVQVLRGIDFEVKRGETVALLGPSGSGKTTLLRLLMGFEEGTGTIVLRGKRIDGTAPHRRGIGLVFQNYALFPHLTVQRNIAFGPESHGWDAARIQRRVDELLELVELEGYGERKISELSGGQQQRVALARALAPEPDLLLLDEPLSNLDPDLRERTRSQLRAALRAVETSCVLVTHEQDEAFELGDRVAVLSAGRLEQIATPRELYLRPKTAFVAGFIGRSSELVGWRKSEFAAQREKEAEAGHQRSVEIRLVSPHGPRMEVIFDARALAGARQGVGVSEDAAATHPWLACNIFFRPEHWKLKPAPVSRVDADSEQLFGVLRAERFTGPVAFWLVELELGGEVEVARATVVSPMSGGEQFVVGDRVRLELVDGALPVAFAPSGGRSA